MELKNVQDAIREYIGELKKGRKELQRRADRKAETIGGYERVLAKTIMTLRNGVEMELDGERIKDPPATTTERIARGICFQAKIDMEQADAEYKNAIEGMRAIQAELNGWQSIGRHQDEH